MSKRDKNKDREDTDGHLGVDYKKRCEEQIADRFAARKGKSGTDKPRRNKCELPG